MTHVTNRLEVKKEKETNKKVCGWFGCWGWGDYHGCLCLAHSLSKKSMQLPLPQPLLGTLSLEKKHAAASARQGERDFFRSCHLGSCGGRERKDPGLFFKTHVTRSTRYIDRGVKCKLSFLKSKNIVFEFKNWVLYEFLIHFLQF